MGWKRYMAAALVLLGVLPASMTGCKSGECADGTVEKDGVCRPEAVCGPGTELFQGECIVAAEGCAKGAALDVEGKCSTAPEACAEGTVFDMTEGACVPNAAAVCGAGTVNLDGKCVPDPAACGPGTTRDDQGRCVITEVACGSGAALDAMTGKCVPGAASCGIGTALSEGRCRPTDEVCGAGTTFNSGLGVCLPDVTCRPGDVIVSGVCAPPAEELVQSADVKGFEPDDPNYGSPPPQIPGLPIRTGGERTTFTGTITAPVDLDGDGAPDQDLDFFGFNGKAGQMLEVTVQPLRGPSLGFVVVGPDGYQRFSPQGYAYGAAREVFLPADGVYAIAVAPASFFAGTASGIGAADWDYVGTVREVPLPTPFQINPRVESLDGSFDDMSDNMYAVTGLSAGENYRVTVDTLGEHVVNPLAYLIKPAEGQTPMQLVATLRLGAGGFADLIAPASEVFVLFDWEALRGDQLDYKVTLRERLVREDLGTLTPDTPVTSQPRKLDQNDTFTYRVTVPPGHMLEFYQNNALGEELDVKVNDAMGAQVFSRTYFDVVTDNYPDVGYVYSEQGGTYDIVVEPSGTTSPASVPGIEVTATALAPNDLGTKSPGDTFVYTKGTLQGDEFREHHQITLTTTALLEGTITTTGLGDPDLYIFDTSGKQLYSATSSPTSSTTFEKLLDAGTYIISVNADGALNQGYTITGELKASEVEPNDDKATAQVITLGTEIPAAATPGNTDVFKFTINTPLLPTEVVHVKIDNTFSYHDFDCRLLTSAMTGDELYAQLERGYGCEFWYRGLSSGDYFVEVKTTDSSERPYKIMVETINEPTMPRRDVEPNSTKLQAVNLQPGVPVEASVQPTIGVDYYYVTLPALLPNEALRITATGQYTSRNITCRLLSAATMNDEITTSASNSGCLLWGLGLLSGDYFVEVTTTYSSDHVNYTIQSDIVTDPVGDFEPNGDKMTASALPFGKTGQGSINNSDTDVFTFTLDTPVGPGEALHVKVAGTSTAHEYDCRLLSSAATGDQLLIETNRDKGCEFWTGDLPAGTYYVEINSRESSMVTYEISAERLTGVLVDTESQGNDLFTDTQALGMLTYPAVLYGQIGVEAGTPDQDVYTFTLATAMTAGQTLGFVMETNGLASTSTMSFEVFDLMGASLGASSGSTIDTLNLTGLGAGDYLLQIKRTSTTQTYDGNYKMTMTLQ